MIRLHGILSSLSRRQLLPFIVFGALVLAPEALLACDVPSRAAPTVAFQVTGDGLVVPIQINGRAMSAILDTGASATVIDKSLAKDLGVAAGDEVAVGGGAKAVSGADGSVAQLSLAGHTVSVRPLLMDLASIGLQERVLVGRDFLNTQVVQLDFEKGLFHLIDERKLSSAAADLGQRFQLAQGETAMLAVRVSIDGQPSEALIDLGSQTPLSIPEPVAQDAKSARFSTWIRGDISGWSTYQVTRIHSLDLGGTILKEVPAVIEPRQRRGGRALLGLPVLERFKVTLDMEHRAMWLRPTQRAHAPFDHDRLGLAMVPDAQGLKVVHVARHSPAERAGLVVGDIVTRIDGEAVGAGNAVALAKIGRGAAGRRVAVSTLGGRSASMVMADYF